MERSRLALREGHDEPPDLLKTQYERWAVSGASPYLAIWWVVYTIYPSRLRKKMMKMQEVCIVAMECIYILQLQRLAPMMHVSRYSGYSEE